jgi:hypothetical protein
MSVFRAAPWALLLAACGDAPVGQQCMNMSQPSPLVTGAQLIKLDVYPADTQCDGTGTTVLPGSAPILSMTFGAGQAVTVGNVPPGQHTIVVTAYADSAASNELGGGCVQADLSSGAAVCLDLTLAPAPDMATQLDFAPEPDMVCGSGACPCVTDKDCNFFHYCGSDFICHVGCKANDECASSGQDGGATDGGSSSTPLCNVSKHKCVQCVVNGDCLLGELCTPAGYCTQGCDLTATPPKNCPGTLSCCGNLCVDERMDEFNCGGCNKSCAAMEQNAVGAACSSAACVYSSCAAGYGDCDGNTGNGCETAITSVSHCGSCSTACVNPNGTTACTFNGTSGGCAPVCDSTHQLCGGNPAAGCTVSLTTTSNCGGCGVMCTNANGSTSCSFNGTLGGCVPSCNTNFDDCDGNPANGCETNLTNTTAHCKTCSTNCMTLEQNAMGAACVASTCTYSMCNGGWGNCDGNAANGCETNTTNTTAHCGTCGVDCNTQEQNVAAASCAASLCTYTTCNNNFGNCDSDPTNGCETNLLTNTNHCNACGTDCAVQVANANGVACSAGACTYTGTCSASNYMDCDGVRSNGCEANLNTDGMHCGSCGNDCSTTVQHASGLMCNGAGGCIFSSCASPYANCDGNAGNGCECETGAPNLNKCCGASCPVKHVNGDGTSNTGQNYFDCYPLGVSGSGSTHSSGGFDSTVPTNNPTQMGLDARSVFKYPSSVVGGTSDPTFTCGDPTANTSPNCVDRWYKDAVGAQHCIRWCFADDLTALQLDSTGTVANKKSQCYGLKVTWCGTAGHFYDSTKGGGPNGATCFCPWPTDPIWN